MHPMQAMREAGVTAVSARLQRSLARLQNLTSPGHQEDASNNNPTSEEQARPTAASAWANAMGWEEGDSDVDAMSMMGAPGASRMSATEASASNEWDVRMAGAGSESMTTLIAASGGVLSGQRQQQGGREVEPPQQVVVARQAALRSQRAGLMLRLQQQLRDAAALLDCLAGLTDQLCAFLENEVAGRQQRQSQVCGGGVVMTMLEMYI
jgi:hypothetical protein